MSLAFQTLGLMASPSYPNAVVWSQENLIAVATGHQVHILNPAFLSGPRGIITIPSSKPFPIGIVKGEDLLGSSMLPICMDRDTSPYVRSLSWSDLGMASNSGCLLAVCTGEGRMKVYHPSYYDTKWVEIMDITDMLYDYLSSINFEVSDILAPRSCEDPETVGGCSDDELIINYKKGHKRRRIKGSFPNKCPKTSRDQLSLQMVVCSSEAKRRLVKKMSENCNLPLITADRYAFCRAMLSAVQVAWSPMLTVSNKVSLVAQNSSTNCFSFLAVGSKSGAVSVWRIQAPDCYSIRHSNVATNATLICLLQAHDAWITTLSWVFLGSDTSGPRVLLATGSSDGSVRIWQGYSKELLKSMEVKMSTFFLLKEVVAANHVPVSVLSIIVPTRSPQTMLIAIGKTSGSFELWTFSKSGQKLHQMGSYDAHDHVVTGFAWAFDGFCLYSCSQDNCVRSWILKGTSLSEVPIPSSTPGLRSAVDHPDAVLSCLGVAVSPGNLVLAMVRSFNVSLLDQMYQARYRKAILDFFWIGAQVHDTLSNVSVELDIKSFAGFSGKDLAYWESSILWSLKHYENVDKPLVMWDIIAALLGFKSSIPKYVEYITAKWLRSKIDPDNEDAFTKMTCRQLHLFNIICRCLMLSELNAEQINGKLENFKWPCHDKDIRLTFWLKLLFRSERELRERLVGSRISFALRESVEADCPRGNRYSVGLAQMKQWVTLKHEVVQDQLKSLTSEVISVKRKELMVEEKCGYCSASVPFESASVGCCRGKHKLQRCAASMQVVCPPTTPLWFCKCCHRSVSNLAPGSFFKMLMYPSDFKSLSEEPCVKPLCPFCGILLQRSAQSESSLSASPV